MTDQKSQLWHPIPVTPDIPRNAPVEGTPSEDTPQEGDRYVVKTSHPNPSLRGLTVKFMMGSSSPKMARFFIPSLGTSHMFVFPDLAPFTEDPAPTAEPAPPTSESSIPHALFTAQDLEVLGVYDSLLSHGLSQAIRRLAHARKDATPE